MKSGEDMQNKLMDIHLYRNRLEYFIKMLIWWVCWFGGIWVLRAKTDGVSSAFFVFALSQLMEFAPMVLKKKYFLSKLCHGLFCSVIAFVFLFSTALLLDKSYYAWGHTSMNILSLLSLGYMTVDWFILLLSPTSIKADSNTQETNASVDVCRDKFEGSLQSGSLGDLVKEN